MPLPYAILTLFVIMPIFDFIVIRPAVRGLCAVANHFGCSENDYIWGGGDAEPGTNRIILSKCRSSMHSV
jgi:hypothetical protein